MIDLHTHSVCSDGSETPERVVELAHQAGCRSMALTDHDGLDGVERARVVAERLGMELISGCEVSCTTTSGGMHILCYFIEPGMGPLQDELVNLQHDRETRNVRLLAKLKEIGLPISEEELVEESGGGLIGRPHVAAVLVRHGAAHSIDDAFDKYLGTGRPAYVAKARVDAATIAEKATASGGVAVLAHPLSLGLSLKGLDRYVTELAEGGLGGLECYYARYDRDTRAALVSIARRHNLVPTGGSDFHGSYKPDIRVGTGTGDLAVADSVLEELRSLCS